MIGNAQGWMVDANSAFQHHVCGILDSVLGCRATNLSCTTGRANSSEASVNFCRLKRFKMVWWVRKAERSDSICWRPWFREAGHPELNPTTAFAWVGCDSCVLYCPYIPWISAFCQLYFPLAVIWHPVSASFPSTWISLRAIDFSL